MVASESFAEFLNEQLAPLGRVTMRRMFGKTGVFCDGLMLGMVTDNTLYFRVDDCNRAAFQEAASFPPLNYRKKGSTIDLSFWRAPVGWLRRENGQRQGKNQSRRTRVKNPESHWLGNRVGAAQFYRHEPRLHCTAATGNAIARRDPR